MSRRDGRTQRRAWLPLERATFSDEFNAQLRADGWDTTQITVWLNDRYQVLRRAIPGDGERPSMVHLSVKRRDKKPVHDWRHLQQIKNEMVGPRCEGMELYPAEERLVDDANQYHLWVIVDPEKHWLVGSVERSVSQPSEAQLVGARQRPFEAGLETDDLALLARAASSLAEIDDALTDEARHLDDDEIARIREVAPRYTRSTERQAGACDRCGVTDVAGVPIVLVDGLCSECTP